MDQILDVFGIDWKVLTVQLVNFAVLLVVLTKVLYKPLLRLIEKRRAQIIEGVANAERAEAALKDADAKKVEIVTHASLQAEDIIAAARKAAQVKEAQILAEGRERYDHLILEASQKSAELKREALEESREEIARLIVLGVEKTLRADVLPAA